jgi:ubiquinone/menaquinone biosynthesis C-methylase UbiE
MNAYNNESNTFMEDTKNENVKFIDPNAIIAQLAIKSDSAVADFGCGPGYFSIPFAKAVGENGKVFALDVLPQALETVNSKMKNSAVSNIVTSRVNLEKENGSKLDSDSVDWVILKDILFQNKKREVIVAEAYRILKTGGKVILVEWGKKQDSAIGPESELRIPPDVLKKMFLDQNFSVEKDVDAGNFHFAFVAVK